MGWTVRGSNPGGGEIFRTCPDRIWGSPSLLYNGYRIFPGGKERPGCKADPSPPSSSVGHERVELYLYSPYGLYGLYRASVPVQGCTVPYSRAIPLLPLWAVRPVQSLSACTRVTFTFCLHIIRLDSINPPTQEYKLRSPIFNAIYESDPHSTNYWVITLDAVV